MKKAVLMGISLAALIIISACAAPSHTPETPQESPISTVEITPDATTPIETIGMLPEEIDISLTREGETELFTGFLSVSERGYAIYLLSDYELIQNAECDVIRPKQGSSIMPEINMQIFHYGEVPGEFETSERVSIGDKEFVVAFNFPLEAAEGGAVALHAMALTMCDI